MSEFEDQYLDRENAAKLLGVDKRTLARWYAQGGGPPRIKLGSRVLYAKTSLEGWLRSLEELPCRAR